MSKRHHELDQGGHSAESSPEAPASRHLELTEVHARLRGKHGQEFWRSLDELAQTPEFEDMLWREFPRQASELSQGVDRRRFMQLMGASLALGGLTACTRQPAEKIVPFIEQPESMIPGNPVYFATAMPLDGYARPLLAESHMGRPTKLEGHPDHPASQGATDLFAQAAILGLYDPERSQVVRHNGRIRTWRAFVDDTKDLLQALTAGSDLKLRLLTGPVTSPSLVALIEEVLETHPRARWHSYSPVTRDPERQGLSDLFGKPTSARYDLGRADVILALDSDFLTFGPGAVRYARDFADRRRVESAQSEMSRFYAAESTPTNTGTLADHRLPVRASQIPVLTAALATALGIPGSSQEEGDLSDEQRTWIEAVAADLEAHRGRCLIIPGDFCDAQTHTLAHAANLFLDNRSATVTFTAPVEQRPELDAASLRRLTADMAAGEVDVLLVLGGNPVYDSPADIDFARTMQSVPRRVHLGAYEDETAELCHWHLPAAHFLESWGDAKAFDGSVCFIQPLIEPLYSGKTTSEVLSLFTERGETSARQILEDHWRRHLGDEGFEGTWRRWLHDGFTDLQAPSDSAVATRDDAVASACGAIAQRSNQTGIELVFRPDPTIHDGCFNNNAWLQECPKPLSKLTWDNAALISPPMAHRLGLESTSMVELGVADRSSRLPVWVLPGHPDESVTLHLGYGRRTTGHIGRGAGFDAYSLRAADSPWLATGVSLTPIAGNYPLASTQRHFNIPLEGEEAERRHLVRTGTLEHYREEPDFVQHLGHKPGDDITLFPHIEYAGHAWGLEIDLSSCTGCNACVIACQAENNIPIVGREMVAMGREMHWIRIDRYFQGDIDDPDIHHQPVMCMHCEMAPCEVVCPVAATVHSDEGLNDMVYNRCVGTRYCSNNCPYKVRRFNFLKYNDTSTPVLKMMRNPDVTVRSRGVMEKCTYCVQRINHARIESRREGRRIADGEIKTACQQSCPTQAIVFGDINDPDSEVSKRKSHALSYGILAELGTRPRTTYRAKLRNPNNDLEKGHHDTT